MKMLLHRTMIYILTSITSSIFARHIILNPQAVAHHHTSPPSPRPRHCFRGFLSHLPTSLTALAKLGILAHSLFPLSNAR